MQLIPQALVPAVQAYLTSQGQNPNLIGLDGSISPEGIVAFAFNEVTVHTSITPDITFPIAASGAPPDPTVQALLSTLQPSVTLSGPAGTINVAPFGQAVGTGSLGWWPIAIGVTAVLGFIGWSVFSD